MHIWGFAAAAVAAAAGAAIGAGATPMHGGGSGGGGGQPVLWSSPALVALRGEVSGGPPASGDAVAAQQTHDFKSDEHHVAHQHAHPCVVRGAATASCFGCNATDSTDILQAALSMSSVSTLTIDRPPGGQAAWLVRPLYITRHNLAVVLAEGVLVLAKQDEFHGSDDSLLKLEGAENITIMGRVGSAMRMRRADYAVPSWGSCPSCRPYLKAEWRAGIWIGGCKNVTLAGLEVTETGGDGLYVDDLRKVGTSLLASRDIHVHDCVFDRNYRQGLSVISVINLLVERCTFSNTNGTDPQAGVDLEPDLPSNFLTNVTFRDCVYSGNSGAGFRTCLNAMNGSTAPVSILFSGADVHNNTVMQDRPSKSGYIGQSVGASYFRPGLQGAVTYQDIAVRSCSSSTLDFSCPSNHAVACIIKPIRDAETARCTTATAITDLRSLSQHFGLRSKVSLDVRNFRLLIRHGGLGFCLLGKNFGLLQRHLGGCLGLFGEFGCLCPRFCEHFDVL